jgi:hypothetical protein
MSVWVAVVTSEHLMPILDATKSSKKVLRAACCAVCCLLILHYPITGILSPSLSLSLSPNPHSFHFFPFFSTYTKTTHPYPSLLSSPPLLYFFPSPSFPLSLSQSALCQEILEGFRLHPPSDDAVLLNALFDIGRVVHDGVDRYASVYVWE